jgi:putative protein-disulfide isomerase
MTQLYYIHDPMCSWCWGFSSTLHKLLQALPEEIQLVRLLGGLAEDSATPMPEELQQRLRATWRQIEATIPGVRFNFDFWSRCQPRRSTYPACRAVIAARQQGEQYDTDMTMAIQRAYYLEARNPSEEATLMALAGELGLDITAFQQELHAPHTQQQLIQEIKLTRRMGVNSFPSLVLEHHDAISHIPLNYAAFQPMLEVIEESLI